MKVKSVFLDFTPLLDVTLIILFYFILFSNFNGDNGEEQHKLEAEQMMSQAEAMMSEADEKLDKAEGLMDEAEDKMAALEAANENQAALAKALEELNNGENLNVIYTTEGIGTGKWTITVKKGEETLKTFNMANINTLDREMSMIMSKAGYTKDSYIFITYIYENIDITPKNKLNYMFDNIQKDYNGHIFITEINNSKEE